MEVARYLELTAQARRFFASEPDSRCPNPGELAILECMLAWGWPRVGRTVLTGAQGAAPATVSYRLERLCSMGYLDTALVHAPDGTPTRLWLATKRAKMLAIVIAARSASAEELARGLSGPSRLRELAAECASAFSLFLGSPKVCLLCLDGCAGTSMGEISEASGLSVPQAQTAVKALVKDGLVFRERMAASGDARRFLYLLTDEGRGALAEVRGRVSTLAPVREAAAFLASSNRGRP